MARRAIPAVSHDAYSGTHPFPSYVSTGHFEVFWNNTANGELPTGWYWWTCEPGCLPDGEAFGPFNTSKQAWKDARNG